MLVEIAKTAIARATLVGWRLRPRSAISCDARGQWHLKLQWANDAGITLVKDGDVPNLDLSDMPVGVSTMVWEAPPDDVLALPCEPERQELLDLARHLQSDLYHMQAEGRAATWLLIRKH